MKILSVTSLPLLLVVLAGTACSPKAPPPEQATVNAEHASLRVRDSATSRTLKVLEPGEHVAVLEKQNRWYRVRLGDIEGWMEVSTLLTDSTRKAIQQNLESAKDQSVQNKGQLTQDANLRLEPGRSTAVLRRLPGHSMVEVLERQSLPREDAPDRVEPWLKVRTSPTEVGWILSSFIEFDVPEGIAPYTEDYIYSAVSVVNRVEDPVAGTVEWYVVGERRPGIDPQLDFTGIRVFTWNAKKERYETAFRKPGIRGVYPLEVSHDNKKPSFRYSELSADGKTKVVREYTMEGVIVREARKPGETATTKKKAR
jgi:SH3-like domain-containing protein